MGRIGSITGLTFKSCPRQYSDAKEAVQDYKVRGNSYMWVGGRIVCLHTSVEVTVWRANVYQVASQDPLSHMKRLTFF